MKVGEEQDIEWVKNVDYELMIFYSIEWEQSKINFPYLPLLY